MNTKTRRMLVCQDAYKHIDAHKHIDERINMSVHRSGTVAKWLAVVNAFPEVEGFAISRAQKTVASFALGRMPKYLHLCLRGQASLASLMCWLISIS